MSTENLVASGTAGKFRLSQLYCSERREPSGRFSVGTAEANRIRRSQRGNSEAVFFSWDIAEAIQHQAFATMQHIDMHLPKITYFGTVVPT